jgi:branched-subunit amino acid ABC-type transport system permease component
MVGEDTPNLRPRALIMDGYLVVAASVIVSGVLVGTIYAVVAAGLSLIHGTILMPQASNGQIFLGAGLVLWWLQTQAGWPLWLAVPAVIAAGLALVFSLELLVFRHFYARADRSITYLVVTLGLAQMLSGLYIGAFGRISDTFSVPPPARGYAFIDPTPVSNARLLAFTAAATVLCALIAFLRLHRFGRALRAVFQNRDVARLRGIDIISTYRLALGLGTAVTTVGGMLYAVAFTLDLTVGWTMTLITFSIMIVGGPGSVLGALCVGLVFGFTQAIVSVFADPTIATFAYLLAMLAMLFLRPNGLFSR